jgi:hypothetical protein
MKRLLLIALAAIALALPAVAGEVWENPDAPIESGQSLEYYESLGQKEALFLWKNGAVKPGASLSECLSIGNAHALRHGLTGNAATQFGVLGLGNSLYDLANIK